MAGPLIVTAELGPEDFARLDALRRAHFPAERNQLAAHLTLFHALPPSIESEIRRVLAQETAARPPDARIGRLLNLGRGVAFGVESPALDDIRDRIAEHFHGCLTAQDSAGWRAHVTMQNKVQPAEARALLRRLEGDFQPVPLRIRGLELHRYMGGPWEAVGRWRFRS